VKKKENSASELELEKNFWGKNLRYTPINAHTSPQWLPQAHGVTFTLTAVQFF